MLRRVGLGVLVVLCVASGARARWEGPADNKSEAALQKMRLQDLFNEGFDVCVRRAALLAGVRAGEPANAAASGAGDYLSILESVSREKNHGHLPEWMRGLSFARTTHECQSVFRAYVGGEMAPETRPAQARPTAAKRPRAVVAPTPPPRLQPTPEEIAPEVPTPEEVAPTVAPTPTRERPTPVPTRPHPTKTAVPTATAKPPVERPTPRGHGKPEITDELPPWLRPPRQ